MKKLIPLCIIGIMVLSGLGAVAQSVTENTAERKPYDFQHQPYKTNIYSPL